MKARILLPVLVLAISTASFAGPDKVYMAKNGTKYHLSKECPALKGVKSVSTMTMSQIRAKRITMCELCKAAAKKKAGMKPSSKKTTPPPVAKKPIKSGVIH